ncbi:hypothetical protein IFM12275_06220 [Nocardia sputorum]|uniref:PE domain-containing protein n=1 Tax=Nocardia TaxID=1817 RepID=UPI0024906187|nr:PE domain-containing protein [Nocardia sputorum]BDT90646.1 hypothetical protein IFM12275_06220 [Nocardia sputorum]
MSRIAIDNELAVLAAGRLESLADGLESGLRQRGAALRPTAAAADAVSRHTSQTLGQVGCSFEESYLGGVGELRKIAANLRSHADLVVNSDDDAVQSFRSLI